MRFNERFVVIDTETAGGLDFPLTYDVGLQVMDRKGNVYEEKSFVVYDIYAGQKEMMESAFYANKLPTYEKQLKAGQRKMIRFFTFKRILKELMEKHKTNTVYAYNMLFDKRALNNTQRFTTNNKYRWFFPKDTEFKCIWNMACQVLLSRPTYIKFAIENGYISEAGNVLTNAECCYRYITKNTDFEECHQGLEDVKIEAEILLACFKQHKKMETKPYPACWMGVQKKRRELGL